MALTKKIFPSVITPTYNNVISVLQSDNRTENGFLHIFDVRNTATNDRVGKITLPVNLEGFGVHDASKLLQSQVSADVNPSLTAVTIATNSFFQYDIQYGEKYELTWNFDDNYSDSGNVGFTSATEAHFFIVGDKVLITQNVSGATNPEYDGVHTITSIPDNKAFVVDVAFGASTPAEAGTAIYSDFRRIEFTGLEYRRHVHHNSH